MISHDFPMISHIFPWFSYDFLYVPYIFPLVSMEPQAAQVAGVDAWRWAWRLQAAARRGCGDNMLQL